MGKHRKWFWISGLYDYKRDILLNGMILSGTHGHCVYKKVLIAGSCLLFFITNLGGTLIKVHQCIQFHC